MNLLVFDISGKFAHFRKYYTNSSSLTYSFPPRTTLCGIISAIMGYERDSYYEVFSPEKAHIALRIVSQNRKILQTVNYMKIEQTSHFFKPKDHTQIPFEIITSEDNVKYRIYFSHEDYNIMEELKVRLKEKSYVYAPYLGAAPFSCSIEHIKINEAQEVENHEYTDISSVINMKLIKNGDIDLSHKDISLMRERMPRTIGQNRVTEEVEPYIFEIHGRTLNIKIGKVISIDYGNEEKENIAFM